MKTLYKFFEPRQLSSLKTKKIILTGLAIFFFSLSYGQLITVGPRVGVSSSKISLKENIDNVKEGDAIFGFHAGLFARITMLNLYIQPEVLFTSNGGKIEFHDGATQQIKEYEFNKLDVPVMVGFKLNKVLRIQAGPVGSLLLKADAKEGGVTEDVKNNYQNATIGYQAGIGLDLGRLALDLKYEGNLSKLGSEVSIGNFTADTDVRNNQWLLSLGILL